MAKGSNGAGPKGSLGRHGFYEWWTSLPHFLGAVTALVVAAGGLVAVLNSGDGDDTGPKVPGAAPPAEVRGASPPAGSEVATIDSPAGKVVRRCTVFRGSAVVGEGRTLALGQRRIDDPERMWQFESYVPLGRGRWRSLRHFGVAPPQNYLVALISVDRKVLKRILDANGPDGSTWSDAKRPTGSSILARIDVRQLPGKGDCPP